MNASNDKEYNGKKRPLYRLLIPRKGDSRKIRLLKSVFLAAVCLFFASAAYLLNDLVLQPAFSDQEQQEIQKVYYAESSPAVSSSPSASGGKAAAVSSAPPERDAQGRLIRFLELQKINPDIVGWIKIPNTNIDLPVLQAGKNDPDFYLTHDYKNNASKFGSIFADFKSPVTEMTDKNAKSVILYGHSLNSGRMFTQLNQYKNFSFLKENPVFTFDTADGTSQWKILSVFLTNTLPEQGEPFDYMQTKFKSDRDYTDFVYQLRIRSLFRTGVDFRADDRITLLSTCSYEFPEFREVVAARRVRLGESSVVDTSRMFYNNKTVYPDCWYKKYGGAVPSWPATYDQAVKTGLLP